MFDPCLGCTFSRFRAIVQEFFNTQQTSNSQLVDDNFIQYISSLVMGTGQVSVGLSVPDYPQVSIAPNPTASGRKRKRGPSDGDGSGNERDELASRNTRPLKPMNENEKSTSIQDLYAKYGPSFRIATNPPTIFRILTGSHTRVRTYIWTKSET